MSLVNSFHQINVQCAFLKERLISDASLLAHEMVRHFNNPMGSRFCSRWICKRLLTLSVGSLFIICFIVWGFLING